MTRCPPPPVGRVAGQSGLRWGVGWRRRSSRQRAGHRGRWRDSRNVNFRLGARDLVPDGSIAIASAVLGLRRTHSSRSRRRLSAPLPCPTSDVLDGVVPGRSVINYHMSYHHVVHHVLHMFYSMTIQLRHAIRTRLCPAILMMLINQADTQHLRYEMDYHVGQQLALMYKIVLDQAWSPLLTHTWRLPVASLQAQLDRLLTPMACHRLRERTM